jgi:hypothetical protein
VVGDVIVLQVYLKCGIAHPFYGKPMIGARIDFHLLVRERATNLPNGVVSEDIRLTGGILEFSCRIQLRRSQLFKIFFFVHLIGFLVSQQRQKDCSAPFNSR